MSKAILVLDEMPEGCKRCPLSIVRFKEYGAECVVKMETVGPRFDWNRPSWCPLREIEDAPDIDEILGWTEMNAPESAKSYIARTQMERILHG